MSDKTDAAAAPAAGADSVPAAKEFDPVKVKALRIKTGVVKRTGKEKVMYRREADKEKEKIEKMKAEGKDEADIKKMTEVSHGKPGCHCKIVGLADTTSKLIKRSSW